MTSKTKELESEIKILLNNTTDKQFEDVRELEEKIGKIRYVDNGENLKDYIKHKLETQRKLDIEEFEKMFTFKDNLITLNNDRCLLITEKWFKQQLQELKLCGGRTNDIKNKRT